MLSLYLATWSISPSLSSETIAATHYIDCSVTMVIPTIVQVVTCHTHTHTHLPLLSSQIGMCWRIPSKHSFHPLCMCLVTHGQDPCDDATPGSEVDHVQGCWGCHNSAFLHSILCNTPSPMVASLPLLDRHDFGKHSVYQVYQRFPAVGILANTYTAQTSASPGSSFPACPLSPSPV